MLEPYRTSDANLASQIIDFLRENFSRHTIILLSTISIVPMDVHQVSECLKFNLGITHIVLDIQVTDSLEVSFVCKTDSLRPNQF